MILARSAAGGWPVRAMLRLRATLTVARPFVLFADSPRSDPWQNAEILPVVAELSVFRAMPMPMTFLKIVTLAASWSAL